MTCVVQFCEVEWRIKLVILRLMWVYFRQMRFEYWVWYTDFGDCFDVSRHLGYGILSIDTAVALIYWLKLCEVGYAIKRIIVQRLWEPTTCILFQLALNAYWCSTELAYCLNTLNEIAGRCTALMLKLTLTECWSLLNLVVRRCFRFWSWNVSLLHVRSTFARRGDGCVVNFFCI